MGKKKAILIGGLVVALVVLVILPAMLLVRGFSSFSGAAHDLQKERDALNRLYSQDPFPSEENIAAEREQRAEVEAWFEKLREQIAEGQVVVPQLTPSGFIGEFGAVRNRLADKVRSSNSRLRFPPAFALGFARYAEGTLPAPENVPRLTLQIKIIEKLINALIESNVQKLMVVIREEFEDKAVAQAVSAVQVQETTGRSRRPGAPRRRSSSAAAPEEEQETGQPQMQGYPDRPELYRKESFRIELRTTEVGLLELLNRLAAMPLFVSVSQVEINRDTAQVAEPPATAGQGVTKLQDFPIRRERLVSGPEIEKPMRVVLAIDVFILVNEEQHGG